jgi:hypothetical protein
LNPHGQPQHPRYHRALRRVPTRAERTDRLHRHRYRQPGAVRRRRRVRRSGTLRGPTLPIRRSVVSSRRIGSAGHAQPAGAQGSPGRRPGPWHQPRPAPLLRAGARPAGRRGRHLALSFQRQRAALHHRHCAHCSPQSKRRSGYRLSGARTSTWPKPWRF